MVKRKVPEGWVEGAEVRNADFDPSVAILSADLETTGVVTNLPEVETVAGVANATVEPSMEEGVGQEVSTSENFGSCSPTPGLNAGRLTVVSQAIRACGYGYTQLPGENESGKGRQLHCPCWTGYKLGYQARRFRLLARLRPLRSRV